MGFELLVLGCVGQKREVNRTFSTNSDGVYIIDLAPDNTLLVKYSVWSVPAKEYISLVQHHIFPQHMKILKNADYISIYAVGGILLVESEGRNYRLDKSHAIAPKKGVDYIFTLPCRYDEPPVQIWFKQTA